MPLSVGDKLGPYEILARIGAGGMGEMYRARDRPRSRYKEKFSERFEREAEERCSSLSRTCSEMGDLVKWPSEACESG